MSRERESRGRIAGVVGLLVALLLGALLVSYLAEEGEPAPRDLGSRDLGSRDLDQGSPSPSPSAPRAPARAPATPSPRTEARATPSSRPEEGSEEGQTLEELCEAWRLEDEARPRLSGVVWSAAGAPLPGAQVTVRRFRARSLVELADGSVAGLISSQRRADPEAIQRSRGWLPSESQLTDFEGRFRLPLPPGELPLALEITHPEEIGVVSDPFPEAPQTPIQIHLPPAGVLEVLREPEPGLELESLPTVSLTPRGFHESFQVGELRFRYPLTSVLQDPRGEGSERKPLDLERPYRAQVVGRLLVEAYGLTKSPLEVEVLPGTTEQIRLRLVRGRGVRGRVVDRAGRPLAGLRVVAKREPEGYSEPTDAEGRFEITDVGEGLLRVYVADPCTGEELDGVQAEVGGAPVELVFDEAQRGKLDLVFVGLDDQAVGQELRLEPIQGGAAIPLAVGLRAVFRLLRRTRSDSEKPESFVRIPAGDYLLKGRVDRFVPQGPVRVKIRAGQTTRQRVQFRVGATLEVKVLSSAGEPLEESQVWISGEEREGETTGPDGLLTLSGLSRGTHHLVAEGPGHAPTRVSWRVPPERGALTIRLGAGILLEGLVRDASGALLPDQDLLFMSEWGHYVSARSDSAGRYRRPNMVEGKYEVVLGDEGRPWKVEVKGSGTQRLDLNAPN